MREYYSENSRFYLSLFILLAVAMFGGPIIYGILPIVLLRLKQKEMYEEMLIGFFLILILSDSYEIPLRFAKSAKNIYVSLLAIFLLFDTRKFQPLNTIYKLFFPFFLISLYCLFYTETFGISVQKTFSYFLMFMIVPNYLTKVYREKGPVVLRNIIFFVTTILIISAIMVLINPEIAVSGGRFRGVLGNPNGLGLFCFLTFLLFFIVRKKYPDMFGRWDTIIVYGLLLAILVSTGSRNSIIAVFIFLFFQRFYKISPFFGFIMIIVIGYLGELIAGNFSAIISSMGLGDFFRVKTLDNGSGRYVAWYFAWNHIQENFFIGRGFGYSEYYMRSNWDTLSQLGTQGGVHNTFLSFWMDVGLVGLLIYLRSYFLAFIKAAKKTTYAYPIAFAITFTAIFESWLVGSLNPHTIIFLMILTIISDDVFYLSPEELNAERLQQTNEFSIANV